MVPTFFITLISTAVLFPIVRMSAADPPTETQNDQPRSTIRMVLPREIFAVVGVETNLYFENVVLVLNPANYLFDVHCSKGRQQDERWTWTPTDGDVGEIPLQLDVRDEFNLLVAQAKVVVKVVPARLKKSVSLLLVGDSLTHASIYSQYLLDLTSKPGEPVVALIGSHSVDAKYPANRHEGYGGWTAQRFATHFTETARQGDYTKRGSPFLYKQPDGSMKLDFQSYCRDINDGKYPDFVTIFLGPNDIFSFTDDTITGGIQNMLAHYDRLIEMIHAASPSTRIGVMLPVPPTATQNAFGSNYASGQTRWQYRRNQHALVEAMIERYSGRRSKGVWVIPTHLNLDCVHNYPTEVVAPNAHSDTKIVRQSNGVHPSPAGYRQIGDSVYAWLAQE